MQKPIDNTQSPHDARAQRALLIAKLDVAVAMAEKLKHDVARAFGVSVVPQPDLTQLSADDKIALGEQACRGLGDIAMGLAPELTLDEMDSRLPTDDKSLSATADLMAQLRSS